MFQITKKEHDSDIVEISLRGIMDLDGAQDLKFYLQTLMEEQKKNVVINFRRVEKVNYSNLNILSKPIEELSRKSSVALCCMSKQIANVVKTAPFYRKVQIFDSKDEALESFDIE